MHYFQIVWGEGRGVRCGHFCNYCKDTQQRSYSAKLPTMITFNVFAYFCLAILQLAVRSEIRQLCKADWIMTETKVCKYIIGGHTFALCAGNKQLDVVILIFILVSKKVVLSNGGERILNSRAQLSMQKSRGKTTGSPTIASQANK